MTWEEFRKQPVTIKEYEDTDIECPKCGEKVKRYGRMVITTYPVKYQYCCFSCGWYGVA